MPESRRRIDRRLFLKWLGLGGLAAAAGCAPKPGTAVPSPAPTEPSATRAFLPPTVTPTATATRIPPTATAVPRSAVALARASTYDIKEIRSRWRSLVDGLGGLNDLVRTGMRVGIKVNLTGGPFMDSPDKPPANELYATNPAVVGAICAWLKDAGAETIYIMDGIADESAWEKWGYAAMAEPFGARLINLSQPKPYSAFGVFRTGPGARIYKEFLLSQVLKEMELFLSVAKLKVHSVMGVTLSLKNLIGLTPLYEYMLRDTDNARTALHGDHTYDQRLPGVILDLNRAVPVDLAVIDGVLTCEGGAGPWDKTLTQVKAGVLAAGRDPVAVDAVGAALMGFDPEAASRSLPFTHTDNYLAQARELGLGTNRLKEIPVVGESLAALKRPFLPAGGSA
jgi:uncharacterized protein (DUF362 family)